MLLQESAMFMLQQTEGPRPLSFQLWIAINTIDTFHMDIMSIKTPKTEKQSKPQNKCYFQKTKALGAGLRQKGLRLIYTSTLLRSESYITILLRQIR